MKIALIHYRLVFKGGLETRLKNYIDHFSETGNEVTVICAKVSAEVRLPEAVKMVKLNLGLMPKKFRKWYFNKKLGKYMQGQHFDFSLSLGRTSFQDAVLAPSNHLGYLKALGQKATSISDKLQIYLDSISYKKSKIIYAASEMMKQELITLYKIDEKKIKILYPPLNTQNFDRKLKQKQLELKAKYGMSPDKKTFLFISTSHKRKGIDLLLALFTALDKNQYELFIIGDKLNTSAYSNIISLGYFNESEELYAAADYTIHPARYEPFGQIISESLQCGTPVIVSSNTGAKEIIDRSYGIVMDNFDVQNWVKSLSDLEDKKFQIPEDFSERFELSVEDHCRKMLEYWKHFLNVNHVSSI